jgi:hypothetical protein
MPAASTTQRGLTQALGCSTEVTDVGRASHQNYPTALGGIRRVTELAAGC